MVRVGPWGQIGGAWILAPPPTSGVPFGELLRVSVSSSVKRRSSVQFSRSVVSDSLRPHESQHARPPCPSPSPGAHSNSRPSSR